MIGTASVNAKARLLSITTAQYSLVKWIETYAKGGLWNLNCARMDAFMV